MESLQEAIEKARLEREGLIGKTTAVGASQKSALPEASTESKDSNEAFEAGKNPSPLRSQLRYSTTRSVELDPTMLSASRIVTADIDDPRAEGYRQLRSQVLIKIKRNNWHSLAITSAQESSGKTLTAINLAICMSQEVTNTVMLVDLDLRTPQVHSTLGIDIDKGVVDHLLHDEPLENILVNPGLPRLVLLPSLPQGSHSSEILSSPEMSMFVDEITNRYPDRIIIFDLPPLLQNDDAMVFVPKADAFLFVVEQGVTRPDEIERSLQLLGPSKMMGTILNKAR